MNSKDGAMYVWDRTQLSKGAIVRIPLGDSIAAFVGAPSWSESNQTIYVGESVIEQDGVTGNGVTAWHVDKGCGFRPLWKALTGQGNQATPLVVGNVVFDGGGKTGGFYAFNGVKGTPLWSYPDGRANRRLDDQLLGQRLRRRHLRRALRIRPAGQAGQLRAHVLPCLPTASVDSSA